MKKVRRFRRQHVSTVTPSLSCMLLTSHTSLIADTQSLKFQSKGYNYGFVEYDDPGAAERAMQTLNGRRVHQQEIRVNWAYQSNNTTKEDTSNHFHIFVGDLSNEVNDEVLLQAFSAFGTVSVRSLGISKTQSLTSIPGSTSDVGYEDRTLSWIWLRRLPRPW